MTTIRKRILLVDDEADVLRLVSIRLSAAGFDVETAANGLQALALVPGFKPHVVVTDHRMDGMDGVGLFDSLHDQHPTLPVILMTANGSIEDAVALTKRGFYSYVTKPFDGKDLIKLVNEASHLYGESSSTDESVDYWREHIITQSQLMEDVLHQAKLVARSDASIFIQGDSGTGKELLAKAIHQASSRREKPFIAVNCTAIPESLLESELFGHKKGAFTGAISHHEGLFRAADQGTLFLDEIGDMPKSFQVKLLRALQERRVRSVGATEDTAVDVRIITATHEDLDLAMEEGRFRDDLYYRLNVVKLHLPPLRERIEDIPMLATFFLQQLSDRYGGRVKGFSPEATECLVKYNWPGNVRQLHNVVEQSLALSTTPLVTEKLIQKCLHNEPTSLLSLREARDAFERDYLTRLLKMTGGNVSQAAKMAKRNRTEFYRLLKRHELNPSYFKA
ncbi:MAG: sigma 54-interacting transcriptional regulator [Methylococcales bacterium]